MTLLEFATPPLTKLIQTLAVKALTQALDGVRRERQMKRLIEEESNESSSKRKAT